MTAGAFIPSRSNGRAGLTCNRSSKPFPGRGSDFSWVSFSERDARSDQYRDRLVWAARSVGVGLITYAKPGAFSTWDTWLAAIPRKSTELERTSDIDALVLDALLVAVSAPSSTFRIVRPTCADPLKEPPIITKRNRFGAPAKCYMTSGPFQITDNTRHERLHLNARRFLAPLAALQGFLFRADSFGDCAR